METPQGEPPNSSPNMYPAAASTGPENEAGGSIRKPGIRRVHKAQDAVFLVVFLTFCVGIIVETSFGFHNGNPLRYLIHTVFSRFPPQHDTEYYNFLAFGFVFLF